MEGKAGYSKLSYPSSGAESLAWTRQLVFQGSGCAVVATDHLLLMQLINERVAERASPKYQSIGIMNDGLPPTIPITVEPRLIPPFALKQSSAFSHGDVYIFDLAATSSNLIVSASSNEIKLYNPTSIAINNILKFHSDSITQIKAHNDNIIMSSSKDGSVAAWDLRTNGGPVQVFS
ncbi:hypothetical protein BGW38_009465, partial [Lunasporangiospora selenospora]